MTKKTKEECELAQYRIPIMSAQDVDLACSGTIVAKAVLEVGGVQLSILKPDYGIKSAKDMIELDFLGGKPLRCGLIAPGTSFVVLYSSSDDVPSLMFHEQSQTTYQSLNSDNLIEEVVVGTLAGAKKNKIIYFNNTAQLAIN